MYKINKKKMFADVAEDMAIVINSETGIYYGINSFGSSVFEYLLKSVSISAILAAINKIQGVPDDMAQRLDTFIETLITKEILIESEDIVNMDVSINPELAITDDFKLELEEYSDAQELLLSDPIHDVDEEMGWQPILYKKE